MSHSVSFVITVLNHLATGKERNEAMAPYNPHQDVYIDGVEEQASQPDEEERVVALELQEVCRGQP